jgi:hypothetical protein
MEWKCKDERNVVGQVVSLQCFLVGVTVQLEQFSLKVGFEIVTDTWTSE